ncbi:hypothetical protein GCM10027589_08860 [Actinocorallia lasiicapitis]
MSVVRIVMRADGGEVAGLRRWLAADPVAREVELSGVGVPGQMGAELIQAVIANAIALPGLVVAVAGYVDNRRRQGAGPVTVEFGRGEEFVKLTGSSPADIQALLAALADTGGLPSPPPSPVGEVDGAARRGPAGGTA